MTDWKRLYAAKGADSLLDSLALGAGMKDTDNVVEVEEILFENVDESGMFVLEFWTRFTCEDPAGQRYFAHLPGRLDSSIVATVREHSTVEIHDEISYS